MNIKEFLEKEELEIQLMQSFVNESMVDEKFLSTKLHEVEDDKNCTFGEKISDLIADWGGSWGFIIAFILFMIFWVILNTIILSNKALDPFPFILLNLILSCLAALQAPIIMMSQNRQEEKDRKRARTDFMINLKAEMEIRNLQLKVMELKENQKKILEILEKTQKN